MKYLKGLSGHYTSFPEKSACWLIEFCRHRTGRHSHSEALNSWQPQRHADLRVVERGQAQLTWPGLTGPWSFHAHGATHQPGLIPAVHRPGSAGALVIACLVCSIKSLTSFF